MLLIYEPLVSHGKYGSNGLNNKVAEQQRRGLLAFDIMENVPVNRPTFTCPKSLTVITV